MPAQGEEVIVGPDRGQPEHVGERLAHQLLAGIGRAPPGPGTGGRGSGAGSAARSSFPFAVSGSASSTTTAAGTMYSGSRAAANSRTSAASPPAPPA